MSIGRLGNGRRLTTGRRGARARVSYMTQTQSTVVKSGGVSNAGKCTAAVHFRNIALNLFDSFTNAVENIQQL